MRTDHPGRKDNSLDSNDIQIVLTVWAVLRSGGRQSRVSDRSPPHPFFPAFAHPYATAFRTLLRTRMEAFAARLENHYIEPQWHREWEADQRAQRERERAEVERGARAARDAASREKILRFLREAEQRRQAAAQVAVDNEARRQQVDNRKIVNEMAAMWQRNDAAYRRAIDANNRMAMAQLQGQAM